jgi:endonuclease/exonuclease/phosphatase family metal-dependent hydrolase
VKTNVVPFTAVLGCFFVGIFAATLPALAQSNLALRVMAANITSGNLQSYEGPGIRIFQGLKPDIVAIQEFQYGGSSASNDLRTLVNSAFGTTYSFFVEPTGNIPNGIVSRYPIIAAGSWDDTEVNDRGFAWAQIDLPSTTNALFVISVHLLTSGSSVRNTEATNLKALIQANILATYPNAWIIVGGDCNTDARSEACINTFKTFLSDAPIPTDAESGGNEDTNAGRNKPYDYVLPSFSLTTFLTPSVVGSRTFPKGLVFDSRVYSPLSDVSPVQSGDSGVSGMQHMAVVKDFLIPVGALVTNPPAITTHPVSQTNSVGANVTLSVVATGTAPLAYQWRFFGTNLNGATATSYSLTNIQPTNAGDYTVVITNIAGSITSSIATLTITTGPVITNQPQSLSINVGDNATFDVGVTGAAPFGYQWRLSGTNLSGATTNPLSLANVQTTQAGDYSVVITNATGSITSTVATLTVNTTPSGTLTVLAGWDMSPVTNYGVSPMLATTNAANITVGGLTRGSGVGTSGTAAGRAWGGNGFDAPSPATAVSANDFATFSISAQAGYNVSFSAISKFDYRRSSTGPATGVLQYQIGAGAFTDITTLSYPAIGSGASLSAIDLSGIAALQNVTANTMVTFRIVNHGATSSGGTWYVYDTASSIAPDLVVQGIVSSITASNPPAIAPSLSNITLSGSQLQFLLTGTTSSNYIVQATTNLNGANWISLRTNPAPFLFIESNVIALPQRFYRGTVAP